MPSAVPPVTPRQLGGPGVPRLQSLLQAQISRPLPNPPVLCLLCTGAQQLPGMGTNARTCPLGQPEIHGHNLPAAAGAWHPSLGLDLGSPSMVPAAWVSPGKFRPLNQKPWGGYPTIFMLTTPPVTNALEHLRLTRSLSHAPGPHANFCHERPDNKHFRLCRTYALCHNDSPQPCGRTAAIDDT